MKTILFILLDNFADWEAAFLASALRGGVMPGHTGRYEIAYATPGGYPVRSIGGLTVAPDRSTEAGLPDECAGIVLVGGMNWQTPEAATAEPLAREALTRGLLLGAICNATAFLAAHELLNEARHTGNTVEILQKWGGDRYTGSTHYEERQAVRDGNLVTANGTGYLEFTRECLLALAADTPEAIDTSYRFNKQGFYNE